VLSAVLAAGLIYLFVTHYKKNTAPTAVAPAQATVWETTRPIPKGTPAAVIAAKGYIKQTQISAATATSIGAIADPSQVLIEATTAQLAVGQTLTAADFAKTPALLAADLSGNQRAVAFSFDSEHGLTSWITPGNTVDIMLQKGTKSELVEQNVTVLENVQGLVVLKLTDKQALLLTGFSGRGSLWLSLRPALSAKDSIRLYSQGS
jgi:Flp pilus assembly protein CpaB